MLIEFNGLPGCGKSTVSREIISCLREQGRNCLFLQTEIERITNNRLRCVLFLLKCILTNKGQVLADYLKLSSESGGKSRRIAINAWRNYCICLSLIKPNEDILIISDQFIIQSVISCFHDSQVKDFNRIQKLIDRIEHDFVCCVFVDTCSTPSIAANRIKNRHTFGGRLDTLDEDTLRETLILQANNLNSIRQVVNRKHVIKLDSTTIPSINAKKVLDYIEEIEE